MANAQWREQCGDGLAFAGCFGAHWRCGGVDDCFDDDVGAGEVYFQPNNAKWPVGVNVGMLDLTLKPLTLKQF